MTGSVEPEKVAYYLDRGVDDLQITWEKNWLIIDYIFSIFMSYMIWQWLWTPPTDPWIGEDMAQNILNLLINPNRMIEAKGKIHVMSTQQANPQILLENADKIQLIF